MKLQLAITAAVTLVGLAALEHGHPAAAKRQQQRVRPVAVDRQQRPAPVVVELFTSEGCSSCPPADELLARLQKTQPAPGAEIIALGEHVDYWNYLGWPDPYSAAGYTVRQGAYARKFQRDGVYTPQLVVDGQVGFAGGDATRAQDAIVEAAHAPKAEVQVSLAGGEPVSSVVALQVSVKHLPPAGDRAVDDVILAITEDGLQTNVRRGENSGRTLSHGAVVRQMVLLGSLSRGQDEYTASPRATVEKGWRRGNLRAVVFVQERDSLRIVGAASTRLL